MTLYGSGNGAAALAGLIFYTLDQIIYESGIAAIVSALCTADMDCARFVSFCTAAGEVIDRDRSGLIVADQFAMLTHDMDVTMNTVGLCCQAESRGHAVLKLKDRRHMFCRVVKELAEKDGITETLKAENQMLWVQRMNTLRETATEIINHELIYA